METFYPDYEARAEIGAEAVFVDLDMTFLKGTVIHMTDEELRDAGLINSTVLLIRQAKALGIPVVMVTRNSMELIDRFFSAKPELRGYFDELIPCEIGKKSAPIENFLRKNSINPRNAIFLDDTSGERDDVETNLKGVVTLHPDSAENIVLKNVNPDKPHILETARRRIKDILSLYPNIRQRVADVFDHHLLPMPAT